MRGPCLFGGADSGGDRSSWCTRRIKVYYHHPRSKKNAAMGFSVPLSSVRLLVPPLRLISAFMWRVVQQQNLEYYDKVEENILLITKLLPGILSERQRTALIIGLRAKMILELCKDELPTDLESVKAHLQTIESSNISKTPGSEVEALQSKLLHLVISLLADPVKKQHFFQEVFPLEYGPEFDNALQVLVGHFLSRLEKLLLVPDFKQAAVWLDTESTGWDDLVQVNWDPKHLLPLLQSDYHGTLETNDLPSVVEDRIISSLSLTPLSDVVVPSEGETVEPSFIIESFSQNNQDMNEEGDMDVPDAPTVHLFTSNQDVIEEIETVHHIFPLNQEEDHLETEVVEELELPTCDIEVEEDDLNNKNIMESPLCEVAVQTTKTPQSESEDETPTEDEKPEPVTKMTDTNLSNGSEEGSEGDNEIITYESSGKRLKVILPKHLVPVVKQISLPSVLLSRCTGSDPVPLKIVPASNPSTFKSNVSEQIRTLRQRHARARKRRRSGTGSYKCVSCNMSFNTHFQASVHRRKRHTNLIYSCPKCEKTFKSMKAWTRHRTEHKEEKPQQCTDCGEQFPSLQALVAHSKTHNHVVSEVLLSQEKSARPVKRRPGECRFCGEMFTPIELRNHLKTHPEFRPHRCDHCGRCFANLYNLSAHISNHTGEKPHTCSNCGKKFFSKSLLKWHMRTHSVERSYCCSYCGKSFYSTSNLNVHLRIHTGERPYVCLQCGKGFMSNCRLQVHQRSHTGEKPYKCDVCGKRFTVSYHLARHMSGHTGVRPFTCETCGKTFAWREFWNQHRYIHTDAKPFICSFCSKGFRSSVLLKVHLKKHNKDQSTAVQNDV